MTSHKVRQGIGNDSEGGLKPTLQVRTIRRPDVGWASAQWHSFKDFTYSFKDFTYSFKERGEIRQFSSARGLDNRFTLSKLHFLGQRPR